MTEWRVGVVPRTAGAAAAIRFSPGIGELHAAVGELRRHRGSSLAAGTGLGAIVAGWQFPDDDFHLTSIWCAKGNADACIENDVAPPDLSVEVPEEFFGFRCFAFKPEESGACSELSHGTRAEGVWFNTGTYPPTFYAAMAPFVGPDVARSVLVMRMVAVTVGILALGLAAWAAPRLRDTQLVAWCAVSIPLWIFSFPSTNPTGWGVAGVAAMWPASYALLHAQGRRQYVVAGVAVALAAVLSGVRADTAAMSVAILVVVLGMWLRRRIQWPAAVLGALVLGFLMVVFLSSGQSSALTQGLEGAGFLAPAQGGVAAEDPGAPVGWELLIRNAADLPDLWVGAFGATFGLGWFDTAMPSLVWVPVLVAVSGLTQIGLMHLGWRKAVLLALVAGMLVALPLISLQASGARVGELFQPRYVLPLVVVFVGIALSPLEGRLPRLTTPQRWIVTGLLIMPSSVALHVQVRRYATGVDVAGINLSDGAEWAYSAGLSPMAVWALGTVAAAVALVVALGLLEKPATAGGGGA